MSVSYSPSSGTTLPLNSSTTITMRTTVTSFEEHANGTSGVFYWIFYDANGNGIGGSGEVGSTGRNSQTATYTARPSNFVKNGVYPAYLEVSGWFCGRYDMEFVDATWPIEQPPQPSITKQPTLSLSSTSGSSISLSWTAATVSNQGNATIRYQYFVGPSSSYSDNYHVGTTTAQGATISESSIILKCGTGFGASSSGSTCYVFVRAYWEKSDGTTGSWTTPTGTAFTYVTSLSPPDNVTIEPTSGSKTTVKWTNKKAGNESQPQAVQIIDDKQQASGITDKNNGYEIGSDVWKTYGSGVHTIQVAHEWYGRYAMSPKLSFTYKSGSLMLYTGGRWVSCEIKVRSGDKWVSVEPYCHTGGKFVPCSST